MGEVFSPRFLKASLARKIKQIFLGYKLFSAWNEFVIQVGQTISFQKVKQDNVTASTAEVDS